MKNFRIFHLKIFNFLVKKFSVYLNRRVFVMVSLVYSFPKGKLINVSGGNSVKLFLSKRSSSSKVFFYKEDTFSEGARLARTQTGS